MSPSRLIFALLLLLTSTQLWADPVTLTFTELSARPANGVSIAGVSFGYSINGQASTQATYGGTLPGSTTNVQPPALVGSTLGILTLDFVGATNGLSFGIAFNSFNTLNPGLTVQLFDGSLRPIATMNVTTLSTTSFTQALFTGPNTLIGRAIITFNQNVTTFALDNLSFNAVPEPAALVLLGTGLAALAALTRLRKHNKKPEDTEESLEK